jgi:hypothetical protein
MVSISRARGVTRSNASGFTLTCNLRGPGGG